MLRIAHQPMADTLLKELLVARFLGSVECATARFNSVSIKQ